MVVLWFIMASITIKDIPSKLHRRLKKRAEEEGRSLNKEVLRCLEAALSAPRVDATALLASIDKVRGDGARLDNDLMQEALDTGRP